MRDRLVLLDLFRGVRERRDAASAIALLSGLDIEAILNAASYVKRGRYVLTGTTALIMRGYKFGTDDIDFLCTHPPTEDDGVEDLNASENYSPSMTIEYNGGECGVDFVPTSKGCPAHPRDNCRRFLTRFPDRICGVPVASVRDVLAFKCWVGREKDRLFLVDFECRYGRVR